MIDAPPEPPPAEQQVIAQALRDCGLAAGGFTVRYEDYLQSIEIVIAPAAGATPDHFACIRAAAGYAIVTFEDHDIFAQYMAYADEQVRPQILADAEADLRKRGLWDGFPDRAKFASLDDYVRALEQHAGIAPGSALRVEGDRLTFDPRRTEQAPADFVEEYAALFSVMLYAAAREGLSLGFIGNDKYSD